jgi:hypothetical protein
VSPTCQRLMEGEKTPVGMMDPRRTGRRVCGRGVQRRNGFPGLGQGRVEENVL